MPLQQAHPAQATKTLRQPLEYRPRISQWLATTQALFNQVAAFYWDVLDAHPGALDLLATDALTALERLTHRVAETAAAVYSARSVTRDVTARVPFDGPPKVAVCGG